MKSIFTASHLTCQGFIFDNYFFSYTPMLRSESIVACALRKQRFGKTKQSCTLSNRRDAKTLLFQSQTIHERCLCQGYQIVNLRSGAKLKSWQATDQQVLSPLSRVSDFCSTSTSVSSHFHEVCSNTKRFAFYQAGKCLLQTLLCNSKGEAILRLQRRSINHPKTCFLKITENQNNLVSSTQGFSPVDTRVSLKILLIRLYAGKAGELFNAYSTPIKSNKRVVLPTYISQTSIFRSRQKFINLTQPVEKREEKAVLLAKSLRYQIQNHTRYKGNSNLSFFDLALPGTKTVVSVTSCNDFCPLPKLCQVTNFRTTSLKQKYDFVRTLSDKLVFHDRFNCSQITQFLYQSEIGLFERVNASFLVDYILVNSFIYSPYLFDFKRNSVIGNLNQTEIKNARTVDLFQSLEEQIQNRDLQGEKRSRSRGSQTFEDAAYKALRFVSSVYKKNDLATKNKSVTDLFEFSASPFHNLLESKKIDCVSQKKEINLWCEEMICQTLTFSKKPYGRWFQIYLPQIETHSRQPVSFDNFLKSRGRLELLECATVKSLQPTLRKDLRNNIVPNTTSVYQAKRFYNFKSSTFLKPSSRFGHQSCTSLKAGVLPTFAYDENTDIQTVSCKAKLCNHQWLQELDYTVSHNLIVNAFSRAFYLLGQNRELLDILADHFIRFGKIRIPEILHISSLYVDMKTHSSTGVNYPHTLSKDENTAEIKRILLSH